MTLRDVRIRPGTSLLAARMTRTLGHDCDNGWLDDWDQVVEVLR
jgi:hypothetical protein